jgi:cytochrome c biogenesis protein CcmG, thiol:disulfide interchange protein DsbE
MSASSSSSHHAAPSGGLPAGGRRGAPRMRFLYLLPALVFAALSLLFLYRLATGDATKIPSALIGRPAPTFALEALPGLVQNGQQVPGFTSDDLKAGRVTVVNVWASWCGPCRQEHPTLIELAKNPAVRMAGINYKDAPDNARRFLGSLGNPYALNGVDPSGRTGIDWGVYGVPETFIVGPDGTIRHKHIGPLMPEHLRDFLARVAAAGK